MIKDISGDFRFYAHPFDSAALLETESFRQLFLAFFYHENFL